MHLPATSTSPREARLYVRALCREAQAAYGTLDPDCCDDVDLVVSELVTNAVMHARTGIELDVTIANGPVVELRVSDGHDGMPVIGTSPFDAQGGAGLAIIDQLALHWGVDVTQGGKTVWCRLPLR